MKLAALFLWVLVPLAVWGAITIWGTPHIIVTYRFLDNSDPYNLRAPRHYIDCTYFGWTGTRTVPAVEANCTWVRFLKAGT